MKKDQPISDEEDLPEKSFSVAFEQMAQLLRTELKMKEKATKVIPSSALPPSFRNSIEQIAKLLRSEVRSAKPMKKRSWKKFRVR